MVNGHQPNQQQQQSLLRTPAPVRPSVGTVPATPVQSFTLQQVQQQPQLRPNMAVRPNALAALLSTSKPGAAPPNASPGKVVNL